MQLKCPACAAAFLAAALATAASVAAPEATPGFGGSLVLPGMTFTLTLAEPGWSTTHGGVDDADGKTSSFRVRASSRQLYVRGIASFSEAPDGGVRAEWTAAADADVPVGELFVSTGLPVASYAGGKAVIDGGAREVALPPAKANEPHLFRGEVSSLSLFDREGAERLSIVFDQPTEILLQDNRKWKYEFFSVRLVLRRDATLHAGEAIALSAAFRTPSAGPLSLGPKRTWKAEPGPDWTPVATEPWIEPGSALDFSGVVPHHAPAGKFGRVVAVGDHFELEDLPGVPQRFYGVNICGESNTPATPEHAERFAANLARMGYNTLRIHHHERALLSRPGHYNEFMEGMDDTMPDPVAMDKFDALVAACVRNGIYITTDLFVSRSLFTTWRSLGIDRDGCIREIFDYKVLCAFWEPAYSNLCAWSRNFMLHKNPYTGRSLAEEPALCTLALINESNLGNYGVGALRRLPGVKEAWEKWLAAKAEDAAFAGIPATFPNEVYAEDGSTAERRHAAAFALFLAEKEAELNARLTALIRDELHCKAPISALSSWYEPVQNQLARQGLDYVDQHFYVDHPGFLDEKWKLPSRCPNVNPVKGSASGASPAAFRRLMGKPFCLTEWNYSGPGRYRGLGGIATGAFGALQGWSGMWRFAWSHGREGVETPETKRMGYFDISGDPLSLAAERAALCLFLRGDLAPLAAEYPVVLDEAALRDPRNGAPRCQADEWLWAAWHARVGTKIDGSRLSSPAFGKLLLNSEQVRADLEAMGAGKAGGGAVTIGRNAGTFVLDTPRTAGGFAEGGTITAGPLKFEIVESQTSEGSPSATPHSSSCGVPATVWVSSLDGEPIATSSHLLLTHLTDVQNSGIEYADPELTVLLKWGGPPHLMRNGTARIELKLNARGAAGANEEHGFAANDDGASRQMTNDNNSDIAGAAGHVIAAKGRSSLSLKERPVIDGDGGAVTVYRISPSGRRLGAVPLNFDPASGILHFTARTDYDPSAATFIYEIIRQP